MLGLHVMPVCELRISAMWGRTPWLPAAPRAAPSRAIRAKQSTIGRKTPRVVYPIARSAPSVVRSSRIAARWRNAWMTIEIVVIIVENRSMMTAISPTVVLCAMASMSLS